MYRGTPEYKKARYLTCIFSAISVWIFMQHEQAEVLFKDLSNDI